jgi:hypothetical protein
VRSRLERGAAITAFDDLLAAVADRRLPPTAAAQKILAATRARPSG